MAAAISAVCVSSAARVEEADDRLRNIALERFGTGRQEKWIVLAPHLMKRGAVIEPSSPW